MASREGDEEKEAISRQRTGDKNATARGWIVRQPRRLFIILGCLIAIIAISIGIGVGVGLGTKRSGLNCFQHIRRCLFCI